jgi:hypothetical protein
LRNNPLWQATRKRHRVECESRKCEDEYRE